MKPDSALGPYTHMLFAEEGPSSSTLLTLGAFTSGGVELRDVAHLNARSSLLAVVGGRAFMGGDHSLIEVDLKNGQQRFAAFPDCLASSKSGYQYVFLTYDSDRLTLERYDFAVSAHKTGFRFAPVGGGADVRLSPRGARVAFIQRDASSLDTQTLTVVNTETGERKEVASWEWICLSFGSERGMEPPFIWLDDATVLTFRVEGLKDGGNLDALKSKLLRVNVDTGAMNDGPLVPGAYGRRTYLKPLGQGTVAVSDTFTYEIQTNSLIEESGSRPGFHYVYSKDGYQVWLNGKRLDGSSGAGAETSGVEHLEVSPDGKHAVWSVCRAGIFSTLKYCSAEDGLVRTLKEGYGSWRARRTLWLKTDDMAPSTVAPVIPTGWTPIEFSDHAPQPVQQATADNRLNAAEHLKFQLSTDKPQYCRHEPIEITLSLTNIGSKAIAASRPYARAPFVDGIFKGATEGRGGVFLREPTPEKDNAIRPIPLEPGQTVTEQFTLEIEPSEDGECSVDATYGPGDQWKGNCKSKVAFRIETSTEDSAFLAAKMARLLATLRKAAADRGLNADGSVPFVDPAILELRRRSTPFLIAAIRAETDQAFLPWLYSPLVQLADPDSLPLFAERLPKAMPSEQRYICRGAGMLLQYDDVKGPAADILVAAAKSPDATVRFEALHCLRYAKDGRVATTIESALADSDANVRFEAVHYLGNAKDDRAAKRIEEVLTDNDARVRELAAMLLAQKEAVPLDQWLRRAASQPNRTRYTAARIIISRLELYWHETHGSLAEADWTRVESDASALDQYKTTINAWADRMAAYPKYCQEYPYALPY